MLAHQLEAIFLFALSPSQPMWLTFAPGLCPGQHTRPYKTSVHRKALSSRPTLLFLTNNQSSVRPYHMVTSPPGSVYRRKLPDNLTDFTSGEGKKRFQAALLQGNAEAFYPLISQLQTQSHPALCALTTLSVVLNALGIDPKRIWMHPWRWFMESLLECCLNMAHVKKSGVTLDELARIARCQDTDVRVIRNLSIAELRDLITTSVRGDEDSSFEFIIASYDRKVLGQTGTGHFSPIAAYDSVSDSVLILDVARFKYGPHWVPLQDLVDATKSLDPATGNSRGFISIRKENIEKPASCPTPAHHTKEPCSCFD